MPLSMNERLHLSRVAQGVEEADLLIVDGKVINVYTGEIIPASVTVSRGRIASVKPALIPTGPAKEIMSAKGYLLSPGFIEPHSHPWVIYNPVSLSNWSLTRGTTTHIMENLPFFQYGGPVVFQKLVEAMRPCSTRFYWEARAVPQSLLHDEKELFSYNHINSLLEMPEVVGIAEITRWNELLEGDTALLKKISSAKTKGKKIDGHTAGCKNVGLNALVALGIASCHEPISAEETLERLRLGLWVMIRNSSIRPDLPLILQGLLQASVPLDRVMMTTDAAEPCFLIQNGYTDGLLNVARQAGVDPITALRMVTLNAATYFSLEQDMGSITPGRYADILFLENLENFLPRRVMVEGKVVVSDNGNLQGKSTSVGGFLWAGAPWEKLFSSNFQQPAWLDPDTPANLVPAKGKIPLIELVSSGITKLDYINWDGHSLPEGIQYCCLLGRKGEYLNNCFIRGFAPAIQGIACSFTTSMGVLAMGTSLEAISRALFRLFDRGGGIFLWEENTCLFELTLEIAGMMSTMELESVASRLKTLYSLTQERGFAHNDLLLCLLFLSCDFLPAARITPMGIFDVKNKEIIRPPFPALHN